MNEDRITGLRAAREEAGRKCASLLRVRSDKPGVKIRMDEDRITGQKTGWQDIATAPRDGRHILAWVCSRHSVRRGVPMVVRWLDFEWRSGGQTIDRDAVKLWLPITPPDTADDITAGLEALSEPIVAEWGEVKDRLNLGKED